MISLKRDQKGNLVRATGMRTRDSSIYTPQQTQNFRISRSKFADFLSCRRCFYLDRVEGLITPSTPSWALNETTDLLLKREFDQDRMAQDPEKIREKFGLLHMVPFAHENLDMWRDSLHHGLEHHVEGTNIILYGGLDDLWYDQVQHKIVLVDYKSQASVWPVRSKGYLGSVYHQSYKVQMDVYAYLLLKMGFAVSSVGYFYVCNADRNAPAFNGQLVFKETLVPYQWTVSWIPGQILTMIDVLDASDPPPPNPSCENCAYARQRARFEREIA